MAEIKADNLINGTTIPVLAKGIKIAAGAYKRGMALGKVDGVHKLIGEVGADATNFNCVLTKDIVLEAEGVTTAYFTGEFASDEIQVKDGFTKADLVDAGRKINIFIS